MKVRFWKADDQGCGYYRCELVAGALRARGHDAQASTLMAEDWLDADVIVGQRVCQPGASMRWQQLAREGRAKLALEVDDNLFDVDPSNIPAWSFYRPDVLDRLRRNMEVADLVTVTTGPLAEVMRQHNRNVAVLPNCVPASLLEHPRPVADRFTLGWSGGQSHRLDMAEMREALARFLRRHPATGLHLMGGAWPEFYKGMPREQVRLTPWIDTVPAFHAAVDFDVALAPLRPSSFNGTGKSAIRCLEAAALGIPVIATDYGAYAEFVEHESTGFLVRRPHEWSTYMRDMFTDPELRDAMGAKARALAAEHTIERNVHLWEEALS